ncbi:MAG: MqnA/MqnD/SBP family protein [Clostridia bacterium]
MKRILILGLSIILLFGCNQVSQETVQIGTLQGPTGMGMAKLMEENSLSKTKNKYEFTVAGTPEEVVAKLINGELKIAALPTNLAAILYQKTKGQVQLAAVNTLGVLYLVGEDKISNIEDLSGKTIYATGQGATPEYVLRYLLASQGITDVKILYKQEHAELAALVASGEIKLAMLPEPFVTIVLQKNKQAKRLLDFSVVWQGATKGLDLPMGGLVIQKIWANENPKTIKKFLQEYQASVEYANANPVATGQLIEKYGIMSNGELAAQALPNCKLVYWSGEKMQQAVSHYYEVLAELEPKAVGGKLPDGEFYYQD